MDKITVYENEKYQVSEIKIEAVGYPPIFFSDVMNKDLFLIVSRGIANSCLPDPERKKEGDNTIAVYILRE